MFDHDLSYYRRRAEVELKHAQAATVPKVVAVHYQLATAYLERIETAEAAGRIEHA